MSQRSRGPLLGGIQPAAYWALPSDRRHEFHRRPGTVTRDVSHTGLRREEGAVTKRASKSPDMPPPRVTKCSASEGSAAAPEGIPARSGMLFCKACGRPLPPPKKSGRRRVYCSSTCRQRARRSRRAG